MSFTFHRIQRTLKSLISEKLTGRRSERRGDYLDTGTLVGGRYWIEKPRLENGTRSFYRASLVRGGAFRGSRRLRGKETRNPPSHFGEGRREASVYQVEVVPWQIEAELMKKLLEISHPGVAKIYDIFSAGSHTYVLSEYTSGPTLDCLDGVLTTHQVRMLGIRLAQTVEFLHGQGISHLNLQLSNLKLAADRPRLMSLSTSKLRGDLSREDIEWVDREDFRRLLETLEKLAGEYTDSHEEDMLCRLLFALEEMIGRNELFPLDILEALAPARFKTDTEVLSRGPIPAPETWDEPLQFPKGSGSSEYIPSHANVQKQSCPRHDSQG